MTNDRTLCRDLFGISCMYVVILRTGTYCDYIFFCFLNIKYIKKIILFMFPLYGRLNASIIAQIEQNSLLE